MHSRIDFAAPRPLAARAFRSWASWLTLAGIGLLFLGVVDQVRLRMARTSASREIAALEDTMANSARRTPVPDANIVARTVAANATSKAMNVRWDALLDAIERATPGSVELLSLVADPSQGEMGIDAQAADLLSLTRYVRTLKAEPPIGNVVLVHHDIDPHGTGGLVRAQWRATWNPN